MSSTRSRTAILAIIGLVVAGILAFWFVTEPAQLLPVQLAEGPPDLENGETMFNIGGCASCHAAPKATGDARLVLSGGRQFVTAFGTFKAPNISPDRNHGIGEWNKLQFANALIYGTSPTGQHYYPAFPYTSYKNMKMTDVRDLYGFLKTLPASPQRSLAHQVTFPFNVRRLLGGWKFLFYSRGNKITDPAAVSGHDRGEYLVNGPGHCAECHTPRNFLGGWQNGRAFAGGPSPDGPGKIPNITPHETGLASWTIDDMTLFFETGFTPEFDSAGGSMTDVIDNTSRISAADREAIATYLTSLPALELAK